MLKLTVRIESWPIRGTFAISRGVKRSADVVVVELRDDQLLGRGECVPYARYDESCESVQGLIESCRTLIENDISIEDLQDVMPAGAARNAIDCALWDLHAKRQGKRIYDIIGHKKTDRIMTAYTLSLDTPENMLIAAKKNAHRPLLKLKLAGKGDLERVQRVREGAPNSRIVVDANEGWTVNDYENFIPAFCDLKVEMIEQPFPSAKDEILEHLEKPIIICADESCHDRASLNHISKRYNMINIKLDKTGGLTEALRLYEAARKEGLLIMVGCMLATSLAMAPAYFLAANADIVDLDGPLLLDKDRQNNLIYENSFITLPKAKLWG